MTIHCYSGGDLVFSAWDQKLVRKRAGSECWEVTSPSGKFTKACGFQCVVEQEVKPAAFDPLSAALLWAVFVAIGVMAIPIILWGRSRGHVGAMHRNESRSSGHQTSMP